MYSWKIIHGKHKRIALQSLINTFPYVHLVGTFFFKQEYIGGSQEGARDVRPSGVQILSFSCSFRQKFAK